MANYNRDNRSGGNRNFGKRSFGGNRQEMHKATCANCGRACEVPFKPTGSKPVLCRDCFKNNQGSNPRTSEQRSFNRPDFNRDANPRSNVIQTDYTDQFSTLNAKMDKILALLTPKVVPLESEIDDKVIEEIVEEVEELEKETKKPTKKTVKKATKSTKKPSSKK